MRIGKLPLNVEEGKFWKPLVGNYSCYLKTLGFNAWDGTGGGIIVCIETSMPNEIALQERIIKSI